MVGLGREVGLVTGEGSSISASGLNAWLPGCLDTRVADLHPAIRRWHSVRTARSNWDQVLRAEVALFARPGVLEKYAAACPVAGAVPADYGIRLLPCPGSGRVLAGIHFYGLDSSRPFVHVSGADFEIGPASVERLAHLVREVFATFRPGRMRVWVDGGDPPLRQLPGTEVDQWVIAGHRGEFGKKALPARSGQVSLVRDPGIGSFDHFEGCFRAFLDGHPGRASWLQPAGRSDLEECEEAGGYFRVCIEGEPGGWIAARPGRIGPLTGWEMVEEFIEDRFRGQGFAAAMQRAFLEALPGEDQVVFGTIDARNGASLATARRVGRELIGGYLFLPL